MVLELATAIGISNNGGGSMEGVYALSELESLCGLLEVAAIVHRSSSDHPAWSPTRPDCSDQTVSAGAPWASSGGLIPWASGALEAQQEADTMSVHDEGIDASLLLNKVLFILAMSDNNEGLWGDAHFLTG